MSLIQAFRGGAAPSTLAAVFLLVSCSRDAPMSPRAARRDAAASRQALASAVDATLPILVGAGNIANCGTNGDESTAAILDTVGGTVFTAGNNVTSSTATLGDYIACYDGSWGRHKARTRPAVGAKDYATAGAAGYYTYFGGAPVVGDSARYYYSYNIASWHVIVLNTELSMSSGSSQEAWLRADLAAHPAVCTVAIWDEPRFYTGGTRSNSLPAWDALYAAGADLVINGHERNYERFAPQNPAGLADPTRGIREIIVGTGGYTHTAFGSTIAANSEVRDATAFGVLKVTLGDGRYDWRFIPAAPATFTDAGGGQCHAVAPPVDQPPIAVPGGPYVSEGSVAFDGSGSSDPSGHLPLTYRWDFGDGSATGSGARPTHDYTADGAYTVTLVVTNALGTSSAPATTTATITNAAPTVNAGPDASLPPGATFTMEGSFSDPGNDGPFAWHVDWGDGSAPSAGSAPTAGALRPTHVYTTASRFTATLTVADVKGASGSDQANVDVTQATGTPVLIGAGDLGSCGSNPSASRTEKTAKLLDAELGANPGAFVYTSGDNDPGSGTLPEFLACWDKTWGRHNARAHPAVGNHEYYTTGAAGYWQYFSRRANPPVFVGDSGKYYYSYDLGTWHVIVLNDNISTSTGSPQEKWLEADLAAHPARCTLAIWHRPKYYQGGARTGYSSIWTPLYNAGVELVLNGHVHRYERYAEQTPSGAADPGRGIREFIVGTGGSGLGTSTAKPANLEVSNGTTWGVLKLRLEPGGYYWQFIPIAGQTFTDQGYTACH